MLSRWSLQFSVEFLEFYRIRTEVRRISYEFSETHICYIGNSNYGKVDILLISYHMLNRDFFNGVKTPLYLFCGLKL